MVRAGTETVKSELRKKWKKRDERPKEKERNICFTLEGVIFVVACFRGSFVGMI
jgi:hypothetical protein